MIWALMLALLGVWVLLAAAGLMALAGPEPAAAAPPPADPYAAQVEEFRAALGDWDRRGRP